MRTGLALHLQSVSNSNQDGTRAARRHDVSLATVIHFCPAEVEKFCADAPRTGAFRARRKTSGWIPFIVFALNARLTVTTAHKYRGHCGFMSRIYSLTEQLSSRRQCAETPAPPSSLAGTFSVLESFLTGT